MKRVCGFRLKSKSAFVATVEGNRDNPILVSKENVPFPPDQKPEVFVEWALTQLRLILEREKPDEVAYKLTIGLDSHDQIFHVYYGLGMLNFAARENGIPIKHVAPQSLKPTAFGLPKSGSVDTHIINTFGTQETPWNADIREAVSVALLRLDK